MLLPDNISPEDSIYYNGALVLQVIQKNNSCDLIDVYRLVRQIKEISMPVYILCLDWLYLLGVLTLDDFGRVELCI